MKPPIGFVLVTHNRPDQTLFLCQRLNRMFEAPPIAIHHDFSQCDLDTKLFPDNVRFVTYWIPTGWGSIAVVRALLSALRLLYESNDGCFGDPDWVVSLSSTDYPIQTADRILEDLALTQFDGFLDSRKIYNYGGFFENKSLGEDPFNQPRYHQVAFNRYVAVPLLSVETCHQYGIPPERFCLRWDWLTRLLTPFGDSFHCYAGDAWFTVTRRVARWLLEDSELHRRLMRHYESRFVPEEAFCHTLLGNAPDFAISPANLRYSDWKGCFAHPRTLGFDDIPRLLTSTDHFARKFPCDPTLFEQIDEAVASKIYVT